MTCPPLLLPPRIVSRIPELNHQRLPNLSLGKDHQYKPAVCITMPDPADTPSREQNDDYDLSKPITSTVGLRQGLTSYGDAHFSLFLRKVFIKALGYSEDALSRPIIGIVNTYSSFNPCHANIPQLIEAVKRGVQLNGGLAIDFPTISLHESFASPTSMFLRNLMSMDTEEMIKAQPVDSVVLIGGKCCPLGSVVSGLADLNKVAIRPRRLS
jgi:hypothetical protein